MTTLTGSGFVHLESLGSLRELYLGASAITDGNLQHLTRSPELEILFVHKTQITDAAIEHLARLEKLKKLKIDETKISSAGIEKLIAALPKCVIEGVTTEQQKQQWETQVTSVTWTPLEPSKLTAT